MLSSPASLESLRLSRQPAPSSPNSSRRLSNAVPRRHILSLPPPCDDRQVRVDASPPRPLLCVSVPPRRRLSLSFSNRCVLFCENTGMPPGASRRWSLAAIFFRIRTYRRSPRFSRYRPKPSSHNFFRIRTYEKTGGRGDLMLTTTGNTGFRLCSHDYSSKSRTRSRYPSEAAPFVTSLSPYVTTSSTPIGFFNSSQHFFDLTLLRPPRYAYPLMVSHCTPLASSPNQLSSFEEIHAHRIA